VGSKEVHDDSWLVSFMDPDLGYFDLETRVLEPLENPFGPKVMKGFTPSTTMPYRLPLLYEESQKLTIDIPKYRCLLYC